MVRVWMGVLCVLAAAASARAQNLNPVYADTSPTIEDAITRSAELIQADNPAEAASVVQQILELHADQVVPSSDDPDLFLPVRDRVHEIALGSAELLERYRLTQTPPAEDLLSRGRLEEVERVYWLTEPGLIAATRLAQLHFESARFDTAASLLSPLARHPDAVRPGHARTIARLWALVASATDDPSHRDHAFAWADRAGMDRPKQQRLARPERSGGSGWSCLDRMGALDPREIPSVPLWSALYGDAGPEPVTDPVLEQPNTLGDDVEPAVVPVIVSDLILVNDGETITAWDRFTLVPRWRTQPQGHAAVVPRLGGTRGGVSTREDLNTVTVAGSLVLAITGQAYNGVREGDGRVHAFDLDTGERLWSVSAASLSPALSGSSLRGRPVVAGDEVVVCARKSERGRRLVSSYLVGLSLQDGSLRWVRLLGSTGSLPWPSQQGAARQNTLDRDVVYRVDSLGVACAVQAGTGRTLWARRLPTGDPNRAEFVDPWQADRPVVLGDRLLLLTPDRMDLVWLDTRTGRRLGSRSSAAFGDARYLLASDSHLIVVGPTQVASVPIDQFESARAQLCPVFPERGIVGRVALAGDLLVVPTAGYLVVFDPGAMAQRVARLPMPSGGNPTIADGHLVLATYSRLHSFLGWTQAAELLNRRIAEHPDDPEPAATLAEMAYRSGRSEQTPHAVERALQAIARTPGDAHSARVRRHLFDAVHWMVRANQPDAPEALASAPMIPDQGTITHLIDQLGRLAQSAEQRAAHQLVLGRHEEVLGHPGLALQAYQSILLSPELSEATWTDGSLRGPASREATRRVRAVVIVSGFGAYRAYDQEASDAAAGLPDPPGARRAESLALRYPVSSVTPGLWASAAEDHAEHGAYQAGISALNSALVCLETQAAGGRPDTGPSFALYAGRLVEMLLSLDRLAAAAQVVERVRRIGPVPALMVAGRSRDAGELLAELGARLATARRLPRIGDQPSARPQALPGWTMMKALTESGLPVSDHVVLLSPTERRIGFWSVSSGASGLSLVWDREYADEIPTLVQLTPTFVDLAWPTPKGTVLERIDAIGGRTAFRSEPVGAMLSRAGGGGGPGTSFDVPGLGSVSTSDLILVPDGRSLAVVRRDGVCCSLDPDTGAPMWVEKAGPPRVHDADLAGGVLVLGGSAPPMDADHQFDPPDNVLISVDAGTGRRIGGAENLSSPVRWVRLTDAGDVAAGLELELVCFGADLSSQRWVQGEPFAGSTDDAWALDDRLLVRSDDQLHQVSISTGQALDLTGSAIHAVASGAPVHVTRLGADACVFSDSGLAVISPGGALVGADPFAGELDAVVGGPADGRLVVVHRSPARDPGPSHRVDLIELPTGRLAGRQSVVLYDTPTGVAVLDNHIVISTPAVTVVCPFDADAAPGE